jgi:hypothetical protein
MTGCRAPQEMEPAFGPSATLRKWLAAMRRVEHSTTRERRVLYALMRAHSGASDALFVRMGLTGGVYAFLKIGTDAGRRPPLAALAGPGSAQLAASVAAMRDMLARANGCSCVSLPPGSCGALGASLRRLVAWARRTVVFWDARAFARAALRGGDGAWTLDGWRLEAPGDEDGAPAHGGALELSWPGGRLRGEVVAPAALLAAASAGGLRVVAAALAGAFFPPTATGGHPLACYSHLVTLERLPPPASTLVRAAPEGSDG